MTLAAIRILALVAAYRERYGSDACDALCASQCVRADTKPGGQNLHGREMQSAGVWAEPVLSHASAQVSTPRRSRRTATSSDEKTLTAWPPRPAAQKRRHPVVFFVSRY